MKFRVGVYVRNVFCSNETCDSSFDCKFFFFFIRMYLPARRLFNETGGFNDSGHASLLSAKLNSDFPCRSEKE